MWQTLRDNPEVAWGFLLALVVVLVLTPAVGRFARILGVVDHPGESRRIHLSPTPRLGGIALLLGIFIPALAFLALDGPYRGILLGAAVATCVGVVDDFRGLPWWGKLGGQLSAAGIAVGFGVHVDRFTFPLIGIQDLPNWVSVPASLLWIVAIMNMVNFLDGMDGLAAGICAIAGSTFAVIALSLGKPEAAILSAIVAGACFGFLRHNFYPARIFMGDSGAMLLGFVLATVSIQGLLKTAEVGLPSESAITAKVKPAIPHTPAARPSIPSRKLTMFINATTQTIVAATPSHVGSSMYGSARSGKLKRST